MTCKYCNKPARLRVDPFLKDVHNEIELVWLCDDCYQRRKDDI